MTQDSTAWLNSVIPLHIQLTAVVENLIKRRLNELTIDYLSVQGRIKTAEGCSEKIRRKNYSDPKAQLTDISGIRVITFFESDVGRIAEFIKEYFTVDLTNSSDMRAALGDDRIGYRSSHFVCQLGPQRAELPEYRALADLKFEIQVRTVLQHAWAELSHDRAYKFSGVLPPNIQRQINLYSGTLEIIDRGFDEISRQIDTYKRSVATNTPVELDQAPLDSITIKQFISTLKEIQVVGRNRAIEDDIISELSRFGVETVGDLKKLVTAKFVRAHNKHIGRETEYGLLRSLMMYRDLAKYFEESWNGAWRGCNENAFNLLRSKYGSAKVSKLFADYDIDVLDDED